MKYVNSVYVCTVDQNDHSLLTTNAQVVLSLMQAELVKTDTSWSPLVLWKCSNRSMLSLSSLVHYLKTKNIHVVCNLTNGPYHKLKHFLCTAECTRV